MDDDGGVQKVRNELVLSFLADALEEIEDERLRDDILTRLDEWLTSRAKA